MRMHHGTGTNFDLQVHHQERALTDSHDYPDKNAAVETSLTCKHGSTSCDMPTMAHGGKLAMFTLASHNSSAVSTARLLGMIENLSCIAVSLPLRLPDETLFLSE